MNLFQNKTILVTGSAGFIGTNLCCELIKYNPKKIIIFDNLSASILDNVRNLLPNIELVRGDVRDSDLVEKCVLESDFVFNLACSDVGSSIISPRISLETNIIGTFNILQAARKKPEVRVVHASSGSVVSSSTPYAISKKAGEDYALFYAKEFDIKVSVIRPHHVFGPYQNIFGTSGVINKFLFKILTDEPPIIWGDGSALKNFTYVQDIVNATILLAQDDSTIGKVYDVASDTKISIKELAHLLIDKYAADKTMQPVYDKPKTGENMQLFPDTTEIRKLGWKPEWNFEDGLDNCERWVEEQINKQS